MGQEGLEPPLTPLRYYDVEDHSGTVPFRKYNMTTCLHCGIETTNPKFCSKSCSAIYTNKHFPKRKTTRKCTKCENTVANYRTTLCEQHLEDYKNSVDYKNLTIGEYREMQSVKGKHPSWLHSHIRNFARSWLKELKDKSCAFCGYDKHVELAHIKGISKFEDKALLSEINSKDNVIQLCPNCHWEFDNLPRSEKIFSRLT